jgi:hypothetical protein
MVKLSLDEGYAYDLLAICEVKIFKDIKNAKLNYDLFFSELQEQVKDKHLEILNSEEYKELLKANNETFDAVEKARYGTISAKEVDSLNMKRYNCKKNLQLKFFPETNIIEAKS